MLLSFKREFPVEEALKCYEILSSHHLELSSAEAYKAREEERRKNFAQLGKQDLLSMKNYLPLYFHGYIVRCTVFQRLVFLLNT